MSPRYLMISRDTSYLFLSDNNYIETVIVDRKNSISLDYVNKAIPVYIGQIFQSHFQLVVKH